MATNLDSDAPYARALFPSVDGGATSFDAIAAPSRRPIALIHKTAWRVLVALFAIRSFA